jgi:hypothetical protein
MKNWAEEKFKTLSLGDARQVRRAQRPGVTLHRSRLSIMGQLCGGADVTRRQLR